MFKQVKENMGMMIEKWSIFLEDSSEMCRLEKHIKWD